MYNSQAYTLSSVQRSPSLLHRAKGGALLTYELSAYSSEVGAIQAQKAGIEIAVAEAIVYASDIDPELILTQVRQRISSFSRG